MNYTLAVQGVVRLEIEAENELDAREKVYEVAGEMYDLEILEVKEGEPFEIYTELN